jgi:EcsC protein family
MGFDEMSAYDRTAWDACLKAVYDSRAHHLVPSRVRELTGKAGQAIAAGYEKVPGREHADWIIEKAFDGGMALTFRPALRTVRPESVVRRVSKRHPSVEKVSDLRGLSLEECDELRRSGVGWTIGSAAEGAATSLMVTGAEVSATVSGGVTIGVAAGAIAADVTTTMAVMGRSIGVVASTYGYDVRQPEEELFALGVLSLASANTLGGKAAAMASLSRLAQQMMRQTAMAQLKNHVLVKVIDRVYAALGGNLTKRKLAQAVPIAGAVINASVNAGLSTRRSAGRRWPTACASCQTSTASTPTSGAVMPRPGPIRPRTSFGSMRNLRLGSKASKRANRRRPLPQRRLVLSDRSHALAIACACNSASYSGHDEDKFHG